MRKVVLRDYPEWEAREALSGKVAYWNIYRGSRLVSQVWGRQRGDAVDAIQRLAARDRWVR